MLCFTFEDISLFAPYAYACENAVDLLIFLYLLCAFRYRHPLEPGLKIATTLWFLATGNSFQSMEFGWRSAHNTIGKFVPEVCDTIVEEYAADVFHTPTTPDGWQKVTRGFQDRWNFPHVCRALDSKHVAVQKPQNTGSIYYNYKGFFSIVMLVLCDANYRAIWAHVGSHGSESDCGIYNDSPMFQGVQEGTINLPLPEPLPNDNEDTPYFFIGDDAFPLREHMLKPYSARYLNQDQLVFNYRMSRARRVVENLFGIMAHRFRCLLTTLEVTPENAISISKACLTLHNLFREHYGIGRHDADEEDENNDMIPGVWRTEAVMHEVENHLRAPRANAAGQALHTTLMHYFNSDAGSVPWQLRILGLEQQN